MTEDNLTAVLHNKYDLRLEQTQIPEPRENEVLLRISNVGICGSDVSYYTKGRCGDFILSKPKVIGHEASGIIYKCGPGVTDLKPDTIVCLLFGPSVHTDVEANPCLRDRVAIEPAVPCRMCQICKSGRYNVCKEVKVQGSLSRYYKHAADFCFKLPDHLSMEEGALLEPLSVAVHACQRATIGLGSRVLITGAGSIGLLTLLTCKAMGASQVCMTDIQDGRLGTAKKLGADIVVNSKGKDPESLAKEIEELLGDQPEVSVECSGAEPSVRLAVFTTKPRGVVALVGVGSSDITVPVTSAAVKEIDIRGVFRYVNCYPTSLKLIASGKVNVKPLITHRFTLEEAKEAFETCLVGKGGAIKVMISC